MTNPLLDDWIGPYGGVPPFAEVRVTDLEPALEAAMVAQLATVDAIAKNPAAPTFDNTLAAMERAGRALDRVLSTIHVPALPCAVAAEAAAARTDDGNPSRSPSSSITKAVDSSSARTFWLKLV